jgi:hypothetical protein
MRQGPTRDRERIDAKIKVMFKEKLDEYDEAAPTSAAAGPGQSAQQA